MSNRQAILPVSVDLLRQALCLPDDCEILGFIHPTQRIGQVDLVISHPSFREATVGERMQRVDAELNGRQFVRFIPTE